MLSAESLNPNARNIPARSLLIPSIMVSPSLSITSTKPEPMAFANPPQSPLTNDFTISFDISLIAVNSGPHSLACLLNSTKFFSNNLVQ